MSKQNNAPNIVIPPVGTGVGEWECTNSEPRVPGVRRKYCCHEVTALIVGVQRYADDSCPWSCILHDTELGPQFHGRSGVDLKDKWRTLMKNRPELASYTENRKNNRQYRPFNTEEEQALIEGVRRYAGERNIWSMILEDEKLGPRFNSRSNVQLKDKFRTMKRAGQIIEVPPAKSNNGMLPTLVAGPGKATKKKSDVVAKKRGGASGASSSPSKKKKNESDTTPIVVCNV